MSRSYRWSIVAAFAAFAFAAPLSAQQIPAGDFGPAPTSSSIQALTPDATFTPVLALGWTVPTEPATAPFAAVTPPAMTRHQSVALMIVGGAALVVGSLIDGDSGTIIMVGGGVAGLIGLFQYLR